MIKKYEVKHIIKSALENLDGIISKPTYFDNEKVPTYTIHEAKVEEDINGDLIFIFKEDYTSEECDKYRIKIEYE